MKPSDQDERAAAITRSKGRMYEYQVPESAHLQVPEDLVLDDLFPLALGTLGDFASEVVVAESLVAAASTEEHEVQFAADVLQAYVDALFAGDAARQLLLYSSCGYYLARM